ncbi:MAG: aminoacyl-tRNA hydrolase, partial [Bacillus sp. (in: firmicutes)]
MKLIVGLGNPGKQYDQTRHNIGFEVIDALSNKFSIPLNQSKFKGLYGIGFCSGEKVILLKPL